MKKLLVPIFVAIGLSGCLHDREIYPGSPASGVDPLANLNSPCPDLSGDYEFIASLLKGDQNEQIYGRTHGLDSALPISGYSTEWTKMIRGYRLEAGTRFQERPRYGKITQISERVYLLSMFYNDGLAGEYHTDLTDKSKFVCMNNRLIGGGRSQNSGSSEWGKNDSSGMYQIYKDEDGNLIREQISQVHMNALLGIPTGTAEYFYTIRFKKLNPASVTSPQKR
ncbi:hypothetical protein [Herbaspirillum hiltneri]|uniref:hypothetical protein n=1 Tax=Herbaspirillum hiltneri TaxID=341045 RepID=UPI000A62FD5A|nr:hypothetical protein [Herbaspirillum hiltneri]